MGEEKSVLLTQEAFDTLKDELAHRQGQYREEITKRIAAARAEGDLSENGGYQAAREEQAKNEGRINELTVKLRNATIVEAPKAGKVGNRPRDDVCAGLARHQGRDEVRRDQPRVSHRRRHSGRQRGRYGELQGPQRP